MTYISLITLIKLLQGETPKQHKHQTKSLNTREGRDWEYQAPDSYFTNGQRIQTSKNNTLN